MPKMTRTPRDLGNDNFSVRNDENGVLIQAIIFSEPDLRTQDGRRMVRRFTKRLNEKCDWFELKAREAREREAST